jgi:8-oxo-dGTP diphosphatase
MRQLGAFTDVNRDPRGRTVSIAFYAVIEKSEVKGSDDAAQARWFPIDSIPPLAFDHDKILRMALEEIKKGMI